MDTAFWLVFLAAIIAITYIAYQHPVAFREKVAYPLLVLSFLSIIFVSTYNIGGLGVNVKHLIEEVPESDAKNAVVMFYAQRINERYDLQINALLFGGSLCVYLLFLIFIPKIKKTAANAVQIQSASDTKKYERDSLTGRSVRPC